MGRRKGGGIVKAPEGYTITPPDHTPPEGYAFGGVLGKVINFLEENEQYGDDWSEELKELRRFCTDASYIVSGWEELEELNIGDAMVTLGRLI